MSLLLHLNKKLFKIVTCRATTPLGVHTIKFQYEMHPELTIRNSTLGRTVGLGLFASKPIKARRGSVLCYFWGKVVVSTEAELEEGSQPYFFQCHHNAIQYDRRFNPIILSDEMQAYYGDLNVYLLASFASLANFVNTNSPQYCNAKIVQYSPMNIWDSDEETWKPTEGFKTFEQFSKVVQQPIFGIELTRSIHFACITLENKSLIMQHLLLVLLVFRDIKKDEEIFAEYVLPRAVDLITSDSVPPEEYVFHLILIELAIYSQHCAHSLLVVFFPPDAGLLNTI